MKNIILAGTMILLAGLLSGCEKRQKATPLNIYTFEQTSSFKVDDAKKMIQQLTGEKDLSNLVESEENKVYFTSKSDLNVNMEYDLKTGNLTYNKNTSKYLGDFQPKLPGFKEADKMVRAFLDNQKLAPLVKDELKLIHEGGLRATTTDGKKQGIIIDKMLKLTYGRVLDSLPVYGAGSKIVVKVGENGEILGMTRRWRELEKTKKKPIEEAETINQEAAESEVKKQIALQFGERATYKISSVTKAYYDNNGKIIQPVFVFETVVTMADKKLAPAGYLCVIPILKNSPEPLNLNKIDERAKSLIKTGNAGQVQSTDPKTIKERE